MPPPRRPPRRRLIGADAMTRTLTLSGAFPRGEELVKATWNQDKGLATPADVDRIRRAAIDGLVRLQQRLGFEPLTNGNLGWQDLFRPLLESCPSFQVGGLQRLFETNKFYRQPVLRAPLPKAPPALPAYVTEGLAARTPWKAVLPSPYWFGAALLDETGLGRAEATRALARHLNGIGKALERAGCAQLQFNDPALFYENEPDLDLAREAFGILLAGFKVPTTLNFPNGDAAPHLAWALQLPTTAIGIDFVETPVDELKAQRLDRNLQAQVVDSQESRLEEPGALAELVARIESRLKPPALALTHTWDLDFVGDVVAVRKLEALGTLVAKQGVIAR